MEAVYFSETSVPTYKSTWCHNPKEEQGHSNDTKEKQKVCERAVYTGYRNAGHMLYL
jgi:hypothetical protein